ncbi:hypothetical protein PSHT_16200 [Puccinia striiformis]|uniref:Wax synthase domain-containing protein n=1 Tax=Puccinia striiformis TaxID=27350 RepID=A0A2S4UBA1_9BASI|nr:hypothetical protein PSHT_16200 [Puccinia striiformis]
MHELAVFSYLMPLAIQAGLFNLVSTRHDYLEKPLIRWTRLGLLPITLSTILSNLISVKDRTHIAPFTKLCIGSMFASQALKSMLFTFNQPAPPDSIEAKNCLSSTDVSKQPKFELGPNHSMHSDMSFLLRTLRRMLIHHVCGVVALICWRSVDNEALFDQLIEKYKFEITVFCCGNFIWTNLDLSGCVLRILFFAIKMVNRSLSSLLPDLPLLEKINQIDLDQTCPILFQKTPLQAKSMTEFWGRHWHHLIKNLILEAGAVPFTSFLVWVFGTGKLHPKALRLAGILAAFTISGLIHEAGKRLDSWPDRPEGVGVCLENTFKTFSGRKVNGILGRIWTFSWLIYFATPMVAIWFVSLAASSQYLKPKITEKSITIGLLVVECGLGLKPHHSTKMGYSEE